MSFALRPIGLILAVASRAAICQTLEVRFTNPACQIAFNHPADWDIVPDATDPDTPCRFSLHPRNWRQLLTANDSVDLFTISLRVSPHDVWNLASESGFELRHGRWVVLGRDGVAAPADTTTGPGWHGVRGTASAGCYHEGGDYAGLCDNPTAVVGTATRAVVIVAGPQAEGVFDRVLATLQLSP